MPRPVNAVDFWRGFALVTIFINHVPGIYYAKFTHANISLSDWPICSYSWRAGRSGC